MNYPLFNRLSPLSRANLQNWLFTYVLQHPQDVSAFASWLHDKYGFYNYNV
jgi:hypothetical protein